MSEIHTTNGANNDERAIVVGATVRGSDPLFELDDSLSELSLLADTAGLTVVSQFHQTLNRIDPATFIGSGKVDEVKAAAEQIGAQVIVFDDELSPRHQRELEKRFGEDVKVLDRSALILDIFAQHAQTREGALQVELAQYEYRLPRLTRQWTHLARQAGGSGSSGGVGLRGPGETQLEVDRREIGRKIAKLKRDIEQVRQHRGRHRLQRHRAGIPVIALVGYTNAGKSTLLRSLTNSNVYVADQLFATLDPTTRRVSLPSNRETLFTDTVGFIQKLPTTLVAAFRATLEEIAHANVLIHVVDVSHPNVVEQIEAVEDTLAEIDVPDIPRILVWNKIDRWPSDQFPEFATDESYNAQVGISAQKQINIDKLMKVIEDIISLPLTSMKLLIPYKRGELVSMLYEIATIEERNDTAEGAEITAQLPRFLVERFQEFQIKEE